MKDDDESILRLIHALFMRQHNTIQNAIHSKNIYSFLYNMHTFTFTLERLKITKIYTNNLFIIIYLT